MHTFKASVAVFFSLCAATHVIAGHHAPQVPLIETKHAELLESLSGHRLSTKASQLDPGFSWSQIEPSIDFKWHTCNDDGFQCARLQVPLDWNSTDPEDARTVALAAIKYSAVVPVTDSRYGGPVLINPGGPGGSGISWGLRAAQAMQKILDAPHSAVNKSSTDVNDGKYYDIISWDPRAVGSTTPFWSPFASQEDAELWNVDSPVIPGTPQYSFEIDWAKAMAMGDIQRDWNGSAIADYCTTPSVVRDMVEIIERHGQWREAEVERLLSLSSSEHTARAVPQHLKWQQGKEPLNFWGISYGTLLGATFAALQPHRVNRVVLDAVVEAEHYYGGQQVPVVQDADKDFEKSLEYCAAAGPSNCSLAAAAEELGVASLISLWDKLEDDLALNPVMVPGNAVRGPDIITLSDVKELLGSVVYQPLGKSELLFDLVSPLLFGNGSAFADIKHSMRYLASPLAEACNGSINPYKPECSTRALPSYTVFPILCSDMHEGRFDNVTREDFRKSMQKTHRASRYMGDRWSSSDMPCAGWKAEPKWRISASDVRSDVTAHPILWIGNTYDPVTPISGARSMAAKFKDSVVVELAAEGHSELANPSLCIARILREYFQTGKLPADNTKCLPHRRQFLGTNAPMIDPLKLPLEGEDAILLDSLESLWGTAVSKKEARHLPGYW